MKTYRAVEFGCDLKLLEKEGPLVAVTGGASCAGDARGTIEANFADNCAGVALEQVAQSRLPTLRARS
jgi:hypothetical protein